MKGISDLLDSDMDDSIPLIDENSILSSATDLTDVGSKPTHAKRGKKRQRVTMPPKIKAKAPKPTVPKAKRGPTKQTAGVKRKATEDHEDASDAVDEDDVEEELKPAAPKPKKRGRPAAKAKTAVAPAEAVETEDDLVAVDETPVEARSNHAASESAKPTVKVANKPSISAKAKTQQSTAHILPPEPDAEMTIEEEERDSPAKAKAIPRNISRTKQDQPFRRRAGSASDTERGDPNLRRKLGDVTRKFENVDLKYRNLKEVGINEANANMEKLRKQCDATMQASNDLIASLKKDLATQAPLAQEAWKLKKQMQNQEDEMSKMRDTTADLSRSLTAAQNEIKALQAKLSAARASSVDNTKTPGSAVKSSQRSVVTSNVEAQMKLDLYSDLTGLVVLNVKKTEEGDSYQCIQTGHNGTLNFRLFIDQEIARTMSFEDTEYLYQPLLDGDRDQEMMKLMPSYLTEEITFARMNASKFYGRVVDTLTKRRAEE